MYRLFSVRDISFVERCLVSMRHIPERHTTKSLMQSFLKVDAYYVLSSRAYRDCKKQWVRLAAGSICGLTFVMDLY